MANGRLPNYFNWVFTLNNYSDDDIAYIAEFASMHTGWLIYGKEMSSTGTPHLQGFMKLHRRINMESVKEIFLSRAHLEPARAGWESSLSYCSKEKNYTEFGSRPVGRGHRTDLDLIQDVLKAGGGFAEVHAEIGIKAFKYKNMISADINFRAQQVAKALIKEKGAHAVAKKDVRFYWGDTGTGKTTTAINEFPEAFIQTGCHWFDGYNGEETVIFDEFVTKAFPIAKFLRLTDVHEYRVDFKGGMERWAAKTVIFTTNELPDEWFFGEKLVHVAAAKRRITEIREFTKTFD